MSEPIKPALSLEATAIVKIGERWYTARIRQPPANPSVGNVLMTSGDILRSGHWASVGELLGFTWEDVDRLRGIADDDEAEWGIGGGRWSPAGRAEFRSLADRIAALLPPR